MRLFSPVIIAREPVKLKEYRYIDELSDIVLGNYCRWIDLNDKNLELKKGGFLSCINISDNGRGKLSYL